MNNLQANNLSNISSKYKKKLITEPVSLDKKSFKKLYVGSFLKLDSSSIKAKVVKEDKSLANCQIMALDNYIFINIKTKKVKPFKYPSAKNSFYLEADFFDFLEDGKYVFSKLPLQMTLLKDGKKYAKIELHFNEHFYIEIKELF